MFNALSQHFVATGAHRTAKGRPMKKTTRFQQSHRNAAVFAVATILICVVFAASVWAQDDEKDKYRWFFTTELSAVWTSGNSESNTFGLGATARRVWPKQELRFALGGTQTESTLKTRSAVGTSQDDFQLIEKKATEKTAELYYARGRYDYKVSTRFLIFGGMDWMRNQFAGIDSRFLMALGAGNTWANREDLKFNTDYGVTYTFEQEVVENPFLKTNFPGLRFAYDFWWQMTKTTEFKSVFITDWNLDNTSDVRVDFLNELPISITGTLKFKPALQIFWRNDPALADVDLTAPGGTPTGEKVLVPLEKLDTLFTISLVWQR
jgi:putative salt-induced outer membrane protein